jgi:hypothetical protein
MTDRVLFPFQQEDLHAWLFETPEPRILWNCNQTGLGKTVDAIVCGRESSAKRILVVTLGSTRSQWASEFTNWWPNRATPAVFTTGFHRKSLSKKRRAQIELDLLNDTHIVSWQLLPKLLAKVNARRLPLYDYVVVEEFHRYTDWWSTTFQALVTLRRQNPKADWKLISGTPINNDPLRSWPWLKLSEPKKWGELRGSESVPHLFRRTYGQARQNEYAYSGVTYTGVNQDMLPKFQAAVAHLIRRKTVNDVKLDLPPFRPVLRYYDAESSLGDAVTDWLSEHPGEPCCIFTYNHEPLNVIVEALINAELPFVRIMPSDNDQTRAELARRALSLRIPLLSTTGLIGTGVDYLTEFPCFLLAQPTRDANAFQQLIGRFCRISSTSPAARVGYLLYKAGEGWATQRGLLDAFEQSTGIVSATPLAQAAVSALREKDNDSFLAALRQLGQELACSMGAEGTETDE